MRQLRAVWSVADSAWMATTRLLCGHWAVYSATLPKSGMTRSGRLYELPLLEQRTTENACSSWPTVRGGVFADALRVGPGFWVDEHGESESGRADDQDGVLLAGTVQRVVDPSEFAQFEDVVRRWETVLGRPVPFPLEKGPRGGARINPVFSEWLMGLPEGWVSGVPGVTWREQVRALGNGVVPQQAEHALRVMLEMLKEMDRGDDESGF